MVIPLHAPSSVLPGLLLLQADNWDSNNEMGRVEKYKEALTLTTAAIEQWQGRPWTPAGLRESQGRWQIGGCSSRSSSSNRGSFPKMLISTITYLIFSPFSLPLAGISFNGSEEIL